MNSYEVATNEALEEAASRCNVRVYPKLGMASALDIERSGLTNEEYSYALKAHFDFVVAAKGEPAEFAIEFDGPSHTLDPKVIRRDALKEAICEKLGMPLLRIDSTYLRRVGRFSLVGWLVELWFLYDGFCRAQERGEISWSEVFMPCSILGLAYVENGQVIEVDDMAYGRAMNEMDPQGFAAFQAKLKPFTPYDPFIPQFAFLNKCSELGLCEYPPEVLQATDPQGYWVGIALLKLAEGGTVTGIGRCKKLGFPPVEPFELCRDLALYDAAEKFRLYRKGKLKPAVAEEVALWREQIARWGSTVDDAGTSPAGRVNRPLMVPGTRHPLVVCQTAARSQQSIPPSLPR